MKHKLRRTLLLAPMIVLVLVSSFRMNSSAELPEKHAKDYECTVTNDKIVARFETQFSELFKTVQKVDAHLNESGTYYYAVYGINNEAEEVVELFKTSEYEVMNEKYNYIEMLEAGTMARGFCYEFGSVTELNENGWCSRLNTSAYKCAYSAPTSTGCGPPF